MTTPAIQWYELIHSESLGRVLFFLDFSEFGYTDVFYGKWESDPQQIDVTHLDSQLTHADHIQLPFGPKGQGWKKECADWVLREEMRLSKAQAELKRNKSTLSADFKETTSAISHDEWDHLLSPFTD